MKSHSTQRVKSQISHDVVNGSTQRVKSINKESKNTSKTTTKKTSSFPGRAKTNKSNNGHFDFGNPNPLTNNDDIPADSLESITCALVEIAGWTPAVQADGQMEWNECLEQAPKIYKMGYKDGKSVVEFIPQAKAPKGLSKTYIETWHSSKVV